MQKKLYQSYLSGLQQKHRTSTVNKKDRAMDLFFRWCKQENISPLKIRYTELLDYISDCTKRKASIRTVNSYISVMREYYHFVCQQGKRKDNPAEDLYIRGEIKRQPMEALNRKELDKLYKTYPSGGLRYKRNRCMIGLLIYQGISAAELLRIEVNDIKLNEGTVYVPALARSNARTLKLEALQAIHLQQYIQSVRKALLAIRKAPTDKLFFTTRIPNANSMYGILSRITQQLKTIQPKLKSLHHLRASVINRWLKEHHIREVQYMAGHRLVSSTFFYHTRPLESLQEQLEKLHPLK